LLLLEGVGGVGELEGKRERKKEKERKRKKEKEKRVSFFFFEIEVRVFLSFLFISLFSLPPPPLLSLTCTSPVNPSSGWYCAATAAGLENCSLVSLISDWPLSTPEAIWPQVPHFSMA